MCDFDGCDRPIHARNLCDMHYQRIKKTVVRNDPKRQEPGTKKNGRFITDLRGLRFGKLLVIDRGPDYNCRNPVTWNCLCDCGRTANVKASSLKTNSSSKTRSCGCMRSLPAGEAVFNRMYGHYKTGARVRDLEFSLTKQQFKILIAQNCHYCNIQPSRMAKPAKKNNGGFLYNGVDRKDNSKGYTEENAVPCCFQCNYSKRTHTLKEFHDWIKRLYDFTILRGQNVIS